MFTEAKQVPAHYQWDPDSRLPLPDWGSAGDNCGPTGVANIAHFYRDNHIGIYNTRRLAADAYGPTTAEQQRLMLERRGVPAYRTVLSISNLRSIIKGGRRPVLLGLNFAKVPQSIAGHAFRGNHTVVALDVAGRDEILIRDANFSRTWPGRDDPTGGKRRYPNHVIRDAMLFAIVPFSSKKIIHYARLKGREGINVRKGRGQVGTTDKGAIYATTRNGKLKRPNGEVVLDPQTKKLRFKGYVKGARHGLGEPGQRADWAKVVIRGTVRYVARPLIERVD